MNPQITEEQRKAAEEYVYKNLTDYGIDNEYLEWQVENVASLLASHEATAAHDAVARIIKRMDHCDCDFSDLRSHWHYCQTRNPLKMIEAVRSVAEPYLKRD